MIKKVLESAGYIITIEIPDYFFPAPTTMGLVSPVFSMGLQKEVEPIDVKDGYETTLIYLFHEKPQSKAQIQLRLFDSIPGERLKELPRSFKDNLYNYYKAEKNFLAEYAGVDKTSIQTALENLQQTGLVEPVEKGIQWNFRVMIVELIKSDTPRIYRSFLFMPCCILWSRI